MAENTISAPNAGDFLHRQLWAFAFGEQVPERSVVIYHLSSPIGVGHDIQYSLNIGNILSDKIDHVSACASGKCSVAAEVLNHLLAHYFLQGSVFAPGADPATIMPLRELSPDWKLIIAPSKSSIF